MASFYAIKVSNLTTFRMDSCGVDLGPCLYSRRAAGFVAVQ